MLVLSRRQNETVMFPSVGITLRVLRLRGKVVSLGIEAPAAIEIRRGEIHGPDDPSSETSQHATGRAREESVSPIRASAMDPDEPGRSAANVRPALHEFRNKLNSVSLAAQLIQAEVAAGPRDGVEEKILDLIEKIESLEQEVSRLEPVTTRKEPANGLHVLIVEDDANERTLLATLLSLNGCQVHSVSDGAEALAYLSRHPRPDIVLLDMGLPRCSGSEFVETVRRRTQFRDLKILAVSGGTTKSTGVPIGPDGVNGWFQKPLQAKRLLESMGQIRTRA